MEFFYHWTLELPFDVLLVHNVAYRTEAEALTGQDTLPEAFKEFKLLRDDEIANTELHKISIPLKRG